MMLSIFIWLVGHLNIFNWRKVQSRPLLIFNWIFYFLLLSCKSSLHMLDTKSLLNIWLVKTVSDFVGHSFNFLIMPFDVHTGKSLILMKQNLSIFSFVAYTFYVICKNPLWKPKSWRFTHIISCKDFCGLISLNI